MTTGDRPGGKHAADRPVDATPDLPEPPPGPRHADPAPTVRRRVSRIGDHDPFDPFERDALDQTAERPAIRLEDHPPPPPRPPATRPAPPSQPPQRPRFDDRTVERPVVGATDAFRVKDVAHLAEVLAADTRAHRSDPADLADLADPADPADPTDRAAALSPPTAKVPIARREAATRPAEDEQQTMLTNSAVMAAGTVVSRMSGFVRSALLAAALGASLHADIFTVANTVPNMLYILLAGGVFNAVLVPQLVRAMADDPDGGEAYTNRVITLAALFLGAVTVALVALAPQLMSLYLGDRYDEPDRVAHLQSVVDFARYCLPQVFFYGMFVLVGQILNARGRFGPMMWAPIANNVISVGVLVVYLVGFGPARGNELTGPFSSGQELLLGIGSTVGIAAQLVILVPYLKRAGFTFRPRFDFRGTGLGHTLRLGIWTVLFVVVNQVAYTVVVRLASGGTADGGDGTGYTIYSSTFLIVMVPHSVITVSLATAILPRLSRYAVARDLPRLAEALATNLRTALAVVLPFAALLPLVAEDMANVIWGHGAAAEQFVRYAPSLALFGPGLVFFTVHYLVLRGFYALELTRTVFYVQCVVGVVNVVAALAFVHAGDAAATSPALVLAYATAYAVGAALSYAVLSRRLGGLHTARLVRYLVRLVIAVGVATAVAGAVALGLGRLVEDAGWAVAGLRGLAVGGTGGVVFLLMARVLRIREVTIVLETVTRRVSRTRAA